MMVETRHSNKITIEISELKNIIAKIVSDQSRELLQEIESLKSDIKNICDTNKELIKMLTNQPNLSNINIPNASIEKNSAMFVSSPKSDDILVKSNSKSCRGDVNKVNSVNETLSLQLINPKQVMS